MSLIEFQRKIGVNADGAFGKVTLNAAARYYEMSNERAAHFFAQCGHESGGFRLFSENLNYSKSGLRRVFRKYFPTDALAAQYARKPEMIANRVYGNRMGNGNEQSGEGWKYRGRGAIQLTGKNNYTGFSRYMKDPKILSDPDIVATQYSFESAMYYFNENNLWAIADRGINDSTIRTITKRINGGYNGLADRISKTHKFYKWLEEGVNLPDPTPSPDSSSNPKPSKKAPKLVLNLC
tara:strand:- start:1356 stop:2066 length:711 start_codon:yes stop_codon:yes gene_type:complete